MTANTDFLIHELSTNALAFEQLFEVHEDQQALWKPDHDKWCLLEIVCHLVDEELLDFRTRVKTARYPNQYDFVPIDPVSWVTSKKYITQDYKERTRTWLSERQESIKWLQSLNKPDWRSSLTHPELGEMSAWQFLENWVAHDYIHLRQITRTKRAYLNHLAQEDLSYAGKW